MFLWKLEAQRKKCGLKIFISKMISWDYHRMWYFNSASLLLMLLTERSRCWQMHTQSHLPLKWVQHLRAAVNSAHESLF